MKLSVSELLGDGGFNVQVGQFPICPELQAKESAQDHPSGAREQVTAHIIPNPHRSVFAGSEWEVLQKDNHSHFHHEESKPHSDAVPGAGPKRQEDVGVDGFSVFFTEPDYRKICKVRKSFCSRCVSSQIWRDEGSGKAKAFCVSVHIRRNQLSPLFLSQ